MIGRCGRKSSAVLAAVVVGCFLALRLRLSCLAPGAGGYAVMVAEQQYVMGKDSRKYFYDRLMPLVFIGGMPRSGTTLLRVLLDAHPDIRCGEETRVIPRLLGLKSQWQKAPMEAKRLQAAGISGEVLDSALAAFTLEIIARHGDPAPRLCNKDPFTLRSSVYLHSLFPNAKFILLLRDGRAVVHSIITRKVTITGLDLRDYRQCLRKWSSAVRAMYSQCHLLGPSICLSVHYEHLVLHPEASIRRILSFLSLAWNDSVLHHEELVGKPGGVSLSMLERSTDQVIKPINTEALTKWVGRMPADVVRDMPSLAPMLLVLGYDPRANPPDYGKPDALVLRNTWDIHVNRKAWAAKEKQVAEKREAIWRTWLQRMKNSILEQSFLDKHTEEGKKSSQHFITAEPFAVKDSHWPSTNPSSVSLERIAPQEQKVML